MVKAGAQAWAAEAGIALIFPDTSPRGDGVSDDEAYDLGQGAGSMSTRPRSMGTPFSNVGLHQRGIAIVIAENFNIDMSRQSITGHSMGGMVALTLALRNPEHYASVSAFAPICNPTQSDWGRKQLAPIWDRMKQHGQNTMRRA